MSEFQINNNSNPILSREDLLKVARAATHELKRYGVKTSTIKGLMRKYYTGGNGYSDDLSEQASASINDLISVPLSNNHCKHQLALIEVLESIHNKTYTGRCKLCDQPIPLQRLLVCPATQKCVPCKEKA